jgi:glutamate formiminotransferase / 5-formyltetrahydrofolate cyclo-ligase
VLIAVPNFSDGRDRAVIERITRAFTSAARLLDSHSDAVHNRTVLSLRSEGDDELIDSLARGAEACIASIDMNAPAGAHPCIGALDVCPLVFTAEDARERARVAAMAVAERIAAAGVPVFLYGELASAPERAERAYFRAGGLSRLRSRMEAGELQPDLGPRQPHPTAGATLVSARPPLAAFNVVLEGADLEAAQQIAGALRESGGGLPGVRAIAIDLGEVRTQISTNVHDPMATRLAEVVERVRELAAARGARPVAVEIVGLVSQAALEGFPPDLPIEGFDPTQQVIERRLA